jgi:hypothetical protein
VLSESAAAAAAALTHAGRGGATLWQQASGVSALGALGADLLGAGAAHQDAKEWGGDGSDSQGTGSAGRLGSGVSEGSATPYSAAGTQVQGDVLTAGSDREASSTRSSSRMSTSTASAAALAAAPSVEALQVEMRRLRARVAALERSQRGWAEVLRQVLFSTLLDASKEESLRARLEQRLRKAIAAKRDSKVSGVRVTKLRLPGAWSEVPEFVLQSFDGVYSVWTILWHPRSASDSHCTSLICTPSTLNPQPSTPTQTPNLRTLHPQPSTLNPDPNPQPPNPVWLIILRGLSGP